ncbi:hypothetical protein K0M31_016616 [Melipona bicolor]|uniref:Secreted protein n=1 Tax=Melipona bicolor TaxID=60889 RepID=A0AA40KEI0_9HYME|nr:hypothetical protein K0M31_016616 [Melipona bicolor]
MTTLLRTIRPLLLPFAVLRLFSDLQLLEPSVPCSNKRYSSDILFALAPALDESKYRGEQGKLRTSSLTSLPRLNCLIRETRINLEVLRVYRVVGDP